MFSVSLMCVLYLQRSIHATVGDDKYASARKEVLTHMCSRPMQVRLRTGRRTLVAIFC